MEVLLKKEQEGILISEMKDGDLAVITSWLNDSEYEGRVIQRYKDYIVTIGKGRGNSWENVFKDTYAFSECYVKLLEDGDELVIRK